MRGKRLHFGKGARRHAADLGTTPAPPSSISVRDGDGTVRIGLTGTRHLLDPTRLLSIGIRDALDPLKAPSKVESLAQMTPEKRAEMHRLYQPKVRR